MDKLICYDEDALRAMKREGEKMSDKVEREVRNGVLDELSNSRRSNKKSSEIVVIDEETRKKFFSLVTRGGQLFKKENPGANIREYEII